MDLPFSSVTEPALDDLRQRLTLTRAPRLPQGVGWNRGVDSDFLYNLIQTWREQFDWRIPEARILGLPWVTVDTMNVVHQRATSPTAPAVVLLHGWPDSVLRFERVLPQLTNLNVIVPALPGFPFAQPLTEPGMNVGVMAAQVAGALEALGYDRYVVSGGDVGADVAELLAAMHPGRVTALHLMNVSPRHALFADRSTLGPVEIRYLERADAWRRTEGGYIAEQSTKPHTLAPALADSPSGLAAWLSEKLCAWSDVSFTTEDLLTWISTYWFTNTIGTSFAPYVEFVKPADYVSTPTVLSVFAHDINPAPREYASRFVNVQRYVEHAKGGHFAAWEQPEVYVEDLRQAISLAPGE